MEDTKNSAVMSRSWVKVSRSWEDWVNGLLRTRTVSNEEVINTVLRNGKTFCLYVNTSNYECPVMIGELWSDGKMVARNRTATTLLTDWDFETAGDDDSQVVFSVGILLAREDRKHRVKLTFTDEKEVCYATITAPDTLSKSFIISALKNRAQVVDGGEERMSESESLLRRTCLAYGWTYQLTCPEIVLNF